MEILYCDMCTARVTQEDIQKNGAIKIGSDCFCPKCAPSVSAKLGGKPSEPQKVSSRQRRRLKRLARSPKGLTAAMAGVVLALFAVAWLFRTSSSTPERTTLSTEVERPPGHELSAPVPGAVKNPREEKPTLPPPPPLAAPGPVVSPRPELTPSEAEEETAVEVRAEIPPPETASREPEPVAGDTEAREGVSLSAAYAAARRGFERQLRRRDYDGAEEAMAEAARDPQYAAVADLLGDDGRDVDLLKEFFDRAAANAASFVGKELRICGARTELVEVRGRELSVRIQGALMTQTLDRLKTDEIAFLYDASPHEKPAKAAAARAAFYLAEGKMDEARRMAGQLEGEYVKAFAKRLELIERGASEPEPAKGPTVRVGRLISATGPVYLKQKGEARWTRVEPGATLLSTDRLDTRTAKAVFEFQGGVSVYLNARTTVRFEVETEAKRIRLYSGEVSCEDESVEVATSDGRVRPASR